MESASTLQDRIDLGVRWIETVYERMRYLKRGLWAGGKGFGIALVDLAVQFSKLDYIEETVVSSILSLLRIGEWPLSSGNTKISQFAGPS